MHVVTFYSYKGGVGRTMALVNCAFDLASRGRRVLIVDFDLEAPGISTYAAFAEAANGDGIIDYVSRYIATDAAPSVKDYIAKCGSTECPIWVMPAGRRDRAYAHKLAAIDWQRLYQESDGYILFEDLKQQWKEFQTPSFDYVLIDSRTGYTDVGGICTRQLPDAVVCMFLPNTQNIVGLAAMVDEIREQLKANGNSIELLFCPANVPDLDDEQEILQRKFEEAKNTLQFEQPASVIQHYNSLDLLDQKIFIEQRPKTRLADEYRSLTKAIIRSNLEDQEGAAAFLEEVRSMLRKYRGRTQRARDGQVVPFELPTDLLDKIDEIQIYHNKDGEIAWALAAVFNSFGNLQSEYHALSTAINEGYQVTQARTLRAKNLLSQGKSEEAREDLRAVIAAKDAGSLDLQASADLLRRIDPNWVEILAQPSVVGRLNPDAQLRLAENLQTDPRGAEVAAGIFAKLNIWPRAQTDFVLSLIGSGQFTEALVALGIAREQALKSGHIRTVFNYAMAEWGAKSAPPRDLLRRVVELDVQEALPKDANYHECLALAYAALGDVKMTRLRTQVARDVLGPGKIFSCWTYLYAGPEEMLRDLIAIQDAAEKGTVRPAFLERHASRKAHL